MSLTEVGSISGGRSSYAGAADAIGGIATVVLTIIGLTGYNQDLMLAIVTIIFGVALLIEAEAILSQFGQMAVTAETASAGQSGAGGLSAMLLAGAAGIVLGVLALLGIHATILTSVAIIAFGGALVLGGSSPLNLALVRAPVDRAPVATTRTGGEMLAAEMATGSLGVQAAVGLAAVILGILAVVGDHSLVLGLVALLALGTTLILTGAALSGLVTGLTRARSPAENVRT